MKKMRTLRERICALLLAVLMPLTSVLPNMGMTVQAAGDPKEVTFYVYEEYTDENNEQQRMPISGAEVKVTDDQGTPVFGEDETYTTDSEGTCDIPLDTDGTYYYSVQKTGYVESEKKDVDMDNSNECSLVMSDIVLEATEVGPLDPDGETETNNNSKTDSVAITNRIENESDEIAYIWTSSNEGVATVDPVTGVITAVAKGTATITVSRNGKEASVEVTVKESISGITLSASPESGTDQKSIEFTLVGMPSDATGSAEIYINDTNSDPIGTISVENSTENGWKKSFDNLDLKGTVTFIAVYPEDESYFSATVSTDGLSYKQTTSLTFDDSSSEKEETITYGETAPEISVTDSASDSGRALTYVSSDSEVVSVDEMGNLTVHKAGTATITITAAETEEYESATAEYTLTVNRKEIELALGNLTWSDAEGNTEISKVYDGNPEIALVGTLSGDGTNGIVSEDTITISLTAKVVDENNNNNETSAVGDYTACVVSGEPSGYENEGDNANYDIAFTDDFTAQVILSGLSISIQQRPVYVQVEPKTGDGINTVNYGMTNDEILDKVKLDNTIVLVGEKGELGENSGLIDGESLAEDVSVYASVSLRTQNADGTEIKYYVGDYTDAIRPVLNGDGDAGNYLVCVPESEDYCAKLTVAQEELSFEEIWERVELAEDSVGAYQDTEGVIWIRNGGTAALKSTDPNYDQVWVNGASSNTLSVNNVPNGELTEVSGTIQLANSNSAGTETKATDIPSGKVKADNQNPVITFGNGLNSNTGNILFNIFGNAESTAAITVSVTDKVTDEAGSGVKSAVYHWLPITKNTDENTDEDTDVWEAINTYALTGNEWTDLGSFTSVDISIPTSKENYYVLLVKAEDNVGNTIIQSSNGVVIDLTSPSVTLNITSLASENGIYNGDVSYEIQANDGGDVYSGISSIEVQVTKDGETVAGDATEHENSYTLDNAALDNVIFGEGTTEKYTFDQLSKKSNKSNNYTISGTIIAGDCYGSSFTITVTARDQAGNVVDAPVTKTLEIDNKAPEIKVSYDNNDVQNEKYFKDPRTMTIEFTERNYNEDLVSFDVTINGEPIDKNTGNPISISKLRSIGQDSAITVSNETTNGDTHTYEIAFGEEGKDIDYTIIPHITDLAGNENGDVTYADGTEAESEFTVDRKAPEIKISYDKNDVQNEKYFNSTRTMTIEFTERNYDENLVSFDVTINGEPIDENTGNPISISKLRSIGQDSAITVSDETTSGDTHTYEIAFGEEGKDIDYTIVPHITDLAGNGNDDVTYADGTKVESEFTVDRKAPEIKVSYDKNDVQNGKYFNSTRTMTIEFTERNYDASLIYFEVAINGAESKEVSILDLEDTSNAISVSAETTNGDTHTYEITFGENKKDIDYTIVPHITDLAGNKNGDVKYADGTKAENEFTVDMVAPVLTVTYAEGTEANVMNRNSIGTNPNEMEWYYTNQTIFAAVEITERNFSENENDFADGQITFSCTAKDAKGNKIEKTYNDNAAAVENWKGAGDTKKQTFTFDKDANYTLGVKYSDLAGNEAVIYETHYFTVDKTAPTGEIIVEENKEGFGSGLISTIWNAITFGIFNNKQTTITFTSSDETSPYTQKYYLYHPEEDIHGTADQLEPTKGDAAEKTLTGIGIEEWIGSAEFNKNVDPQTAYTKANTQQIPYLRLEDKAGNVAFYSTSGIIDDRNNPEGALIEITTIDPNTGETDTGKEIFNGDVAFEISVSDPKTHETYAGLHSVSYRVLADGVVTQEAKYYEEEVEELKAADRIQSVEWTQSSADKPIVYAAENNSNNVEIEVTAVDNAGNVSVAVRKLAIDTTDPEIYVEYDNNEVSNGSYFKADRVMTVRYTERNFYEKGLTFDVTLDGVTQKGISLDTLKTLDGIRVESGPSDSQAGTAFESLTDERTIEYKIRFDGGKEKDKDYTIVPHIMDEVSRKNSGVEYAEGTQAQKTFTVDKTAPVIRIVYKAGESKIAPGTQKEPIVTENTEDITAEVSITERNFSKSSSFVEEQMVLTYTATDYEGNTVGTSDTADAENPIEDYTKTANTRSQWATEGNVRTHTFTFTKDANYTLALAYTDLAGNTAVYDTRYFTLDKTAPTGSVQIRETVWSKLLEMVTFGFFNQEKEAVTLTGSDKTSGVDAIQYYKYIPDVESRNQFKGLTAAQLDEITDWTDGESLTVNEEEQAIVYEKITDRAGNVTYINSEEGVIVDHTAPGTPEITITTAEPSQGIYNGNANFTIQVTDPVSGGTYAGLKEVYYEVRNNGTVTQSGNYNDELSDHTARVHSLTKNETVIAEQNNSNDVTIWAKAVDYAGNETEVTKEIKIDITKPRVEISFDLNNPLNGKYYNATRTATVTVYERNFDPNAVDFTITNTDGTMPAISGWSISPQAGISDDAVNTCTVTFAADGDYTLTMNCTDQANNRSEYTEVHEFTIDKTVPVINVSFDNNNVQNGTYYNAPRTATITVNEHNFNGSEVQTAINASLQAQGISAPGVNGWSASGDTHTATVYFSADGDYSFTVNYTDLAGNAAETCNVSQFTVDQTKPTVEIFDIIDKSANNGAVEPGVRYSDINYNAANVEITISGPKHSPKAIDGVRTSIPNGESIKMADFAHEESVDDVYTLTAKVTDLAGNSDEKSVIFSVNRFGSNFIFGDSTEAFLERYYSNKEQDLIVTEINVDTLEHYGISYGRDGELVNLEQGTDYTVKASGNEVSWKSYQYTIKAENFEAEGLYNVTIDSRDRAANEINNKVKGADIEFVIDKTAPTVVITGIEDNRQYRANSRDITISVADNVAIGGMDVYVDDNEHPTESYDAESIVKQKGEIPFVLGSSSNWQKLSAAATDAAGNTAETSEYRILITSNLLVQFYRNTPLVIGSSVSILAVIAVLILLLGKRRKKEEEEA